MIFCFSATIHQNSFFINTFNFNFLLQHACTSLDCGLLLVKSRIKLQEFDLAADDLEKLQDAFGEQFQFKLLSATLHRARGERQKALQLLEEFVQVQR